MINRDELIKQKLLEKEISNSRLFVDHEQKIKTDVLEQTTFEPSKKEYELLQEQIGVKYLPLYEKGDVVYISSKNENLKGYLNQEFRISAITTHEFYSIGNANAVYLHVVHQNHIKPKNKIKYYSRLIKKFFQKLFK